MEKKDFCPRINTDFHRLAPALFSFAVQFSRHFIDGRGRTRFPLIGDEGRWRRKIFAHGLTRIFTDWRLLCSASLLNSAAILLMEEEERGSR